MKENKALHQRLEHYAYQEITVLQRDLHLTSQGYDTKQVEKNTDVTQWPVKQPILFFIALDVPLLIPLRSS